MRISLLLALGLVACGAEPHIKGSGSPDGPAKDTTHVEAEENKPDFGNLEIETGCELNGTDLRKEIQLKAKFYYAQDSITYVDAGKLDSYGLMGFDYSEIPVDSTADHLLRFANENSVAEIYVSDFREVEHRITYDTTSGYARVCNIDGETPWGTQSNMPSRQIDSIKLLFKGEIIEFPKKAYADLYQPNILCKPDCYAKFYKTDFGHLLMMMNSDGAGSYCVIWLFESGKYIGRSVTRPF